MRCHVVFGQTCRTPDPAMFYHIVAVWFQGCAIACRYILLYNKCDVSLTAYNWVSLTFNVSPVFSLDVTCQTPILVMALSSLSL